MKIFEETGSAENRKTLTDQTFVTESIDEDPSTSIP